MFRMGVKLGLLAGGLRRKFGSTTKVVKENEENCIMRSFIICSFHKILG
jgi:hypothetical protein